MQILNHFKILDSYLPDLRQSWILLALTALVGMLTAGLGTIAISFALPSAAKWADLIIYPLVFLPATIFIAGDIRNQRDIINIQPNITLPARPLNSNFFGNIGMPLSFIIIFFLTFSFNIATEPLYTWMGVPDFLREFYDNMKLNPWSSFLTVVIFAPIFEELLCRGIILRGLLHHITPAKAIFWSALMFAVMHLNPWQALPAFMVGLLMGWIYWKTGSLLATIFIHFINNGFSFIITLLFPDMGADATFSSLMPFNKYIILYVFSILFTIAALWYLKSNYDKSISTEV